MALRERDIPTIFTGVDVIPRAQFGPGTDNLQLLLDYEHWTAGDPLPNEYVENSGITSLADNNTVGEETASPLVGAKSGTYDGGVDETHNSAAKDWSLDSQDFCFTAFIRVVSGGGNNPLLSISDSTSESGADLFFADGASEIAFAVESSASGRERLASAYPGGKVMVQGWYTHSNNTGHLRINDGVETTKVIGPPDNEALPFTIADLADGGYNNNTITVDMAMVEIAPQGDLFWPNHPTWLYNGGAGRTTNEILTYNP